MVGRFFLLKHKLLINRLLKMNRLLYENKKGPHLEGPLFKIYLLSCFSFLSVCERKR